MRQDYEDRIRQLEERLNRVEPAIAAKQPETPAATARADARRGLHGANVGLAAERALCLAQRDPATYALPGFLLPRPDPATGLALGRASLPSRAISIRISSAAPRSPTPRRAPRPRLTLKKPSIATTALPAWLHRQRRALSTRASVTSTSSIATPTTSPTGRCRTRAMLANRGGDAGVYADDGLQVRWVAPTETFFELGAELFQKGGELRRPGARGARA